MAELIKSSDFEKKPILTDTIKTFKDSNDTIDRVNSAMKQGTELIDKFMIFLDRLKEVNQKKNNPNQQTFQLIDSNNSEPLQRSTEVIRKTKVMSFNIDGAIVDLLGKLEKLAKEYPDKTIAEFVNKDLIELMDTGLAKPVITNWVNQFIIYNEVNEW